MVKGKTNIGLVEYAIAQLGLPYWYGTYGAIATEALYLAKKKQYPSQYKATDFCTQYGLRVHDCSGLVKGYIFSETPVSPPKYKKEYDKSANGLRACCSTQGSMEALPEIPGLLVFKEGHVGVYIGDGYIVEAKGHKYGVIKTRVSDSKWLCWGKLDWIYYEDEPVEEPADLPRLKKGCKGDAVKSLQVLLNYKGMTDSGGLKLDVDGSFGPKTEYAVKTYQVKKDMGKTGIVSGPFWEALIN